MPRIKQTAPNRNSNKLSLHAVSRKVKNSETVDKNTQSDDQTVLPQKKRRKKPGTGALIEIRRLHKKDINIIPKSTFRKLLRQILNDVSISPMRMQGNAVRVLREMSAKYLHHIFVFANALCVKENRLELNLKDYVMATNIISGDFQKALDMPDASERLLRAPPRLTYQMQAPIIAKKKTGDLKVTAKPKNKSDKVKESQETCSEDTKITEDDE
ncbi:histone H3 [Cymbomonas tetramitiformis]|uniref:Histone H3 n=1 Tax=Cymbomonas tetramitiformis TaxID=36881 RepID=A0AAE0BTR4_9CHLO|nr:histone H3 [Cymbomonas tetramitiformis]|eukprot:gene12960-15323_t